VTNSTRFKAKNYTSFVDVKTTTTTTTTTTTNTTSLLPPPTTITANYYYKTSQFYLSYSSLSWDSERYLLRTFRT